MAFEQTTQPTQKKIKGPNIAYVRSEVIALQAKWEMIADCIAGQEAVKVKGELYLPRPNPADLSDENTKRYEAYKKRAVFYNVVRRTLDGMVSQVFSRDPICKLPKELDLLKANADGTGIALDQQSKDALIKNVAFGRAGLLTDYPRTERPATVAELQEGNIRPTIVKYNPLDIINWRYRVTGSASKLELVVLKEQKTVSDDGFQAVQEPRWRVLQLDALGEYTVTIYKENANDDGDTYIAEEGPYKPKDGDGKFWTEIPFEFIGATDNNANPDEPHMYDMAVLNISHYRNSADYEDSCYMVGQPTPVFAGLTQQWVDNVLKGEITLGSRTAVLLPQGGTADLLQVNENSMPMEAMKHKEAQMVSLGAKLITQRATQRTLGEAQLEESTEASILSTATKNVATAYTRALKWAAKFLGISDKEIEYSLNTDFPASRLSPNDRNQLVLEWQAEAITWEEMRAGLRRGGVATVDDAKARTDIKANPPPQPIGAGEVRNKGEGGDPDKVQKKNPDPENNGGNQAGN